MFGRKAKTQAANGPKKRSILDLDHQAGVPRELQWLAYALECQHTEAGAEALARAWSEWRSNRVPDTSVQR